MLMPRPSNVRIAHLKVVHLVILAFLTEDEKGKADFIDMQVQQLNRDPPKTERGRVKFWGQKVSIFVDC